MAYCETVLLRFVLTSVLCASMVAGCASPGPSFAPLNQPVMPPPARNASLDRGFAWQSDARSRPSPRFSLGVVRPIDRARVLARWKSQSAPRGSCSPIELASGDLAIGTCGGLPPMHTSRWAARRARSATNALSFDGASTAAGPRPASVDLRETPSDGPVKNQGMVGVCWAFALSSIMESALGRQGIRDEVAPLHLVVSDAWTSIHDRGTSKPMVSGASWVYDPAKACKLDSRADATCEEAYHVKQGSWQVDSSLHAEVDSANARGAYQVVKLEVIDPVSFDALADTVAKGIEVYLSIDVDDQNWSRTTGSIDDYPVGTRGPHAVTVVGYRENGPRGREILIKNSWGANWGQGGYAWLTEAMLTKHGNDMFVVEAQRTGAGPSPQPNSNGPFGFPMPPGLPALPSIPGFPTSPGLPSAPALPALPAIPGFPGLQLPQAQPNQQTTPQPSACAAGQTQDLVTRACVSPCRNGFPPAAGVCAP